MHRKEEDIVLANFLNASTSYIETEHFNVIYAVNEYDSLFLYVSKYDEQRYFELDVNH